MKIYKKILLLPLLAFSLLLSGCEEIALLPDDAAVASAESIPAYAGEAYVVLQENQPNFTAEELSLSPVERYGGLDELGRCTGAFAMLAQELMPTEERGSIGQVKPSGWQTVKYDNVDGKYLYNRCHLIGFQLTGENANAQNLITGTRYLNIEGMLPFENMLADYIKETGDHVLYRVTPHFSGEELVARGVELEALSVGDAGESICFHVYCYNVQPGIEIDYATGESHALPQEAAAQEGYILNTKNGKFHLPDCSAVGQLQAENREEYFVSREEMISQGYVPCGKCKP